MPRLCIMSRRHRLEIGQGEKNTRQEHDEAWETREKSSDVSERHL